jgi:hypothetical protein
VFPILDKVSLADDTFIPRCNNSLPELIESAEKSLEAITKWLEKLSARKSNGRFLDRQW